MIVAALVLLIISFVLFLLIQLSYSKENIAKKRKIISNFMMCTIVGASVAFVLQGYFVVSQNDDVQKSIGTIISDINNPLVVTADAAEFVYEKDQNNNDDIRIITITKNSVVKDTSNNQISKDNLIGKPICTCYTGDQGEVCIFIGQYDENYNWTGKCTICAYKNGKLYYSTENIYENSKMVEYRRASKSSSNKNWVITEKKVLENGLTEGDTRSYGYDEIPSKIDDVSIYNDGKEYIPNVEDIYSIDDLYEILQPGILSHYYGMYDIEGDWDDDTGNAYCIVYEGKEIIDSVLKGEFKGATFISGNMYELIGNEKVIHSLGKFHNVQGKSDDIGNGSSVSEQLNMEQFKIAIRGEQFENEVLSVIDRL